MRGRRPKPTVIKILSGNPGHRPLNKSEPKFGGSPRCPSWLTPDAKKEWKRISSELAALNMLRSVDTAALASYCQSFSRWQQAEKIVEIEGQVIKEPVLNKNREVIGHKTKRNPATTIARDERASMLRSAGLFGFDPSSRSRLSTGEAAPQTDAFEDFLKEVVDD